MTKITRDEFIRRTKAEWAIATLTVELALMKRKRRPRRGTPKRQKKLYIHSIADDR